VPRRGGAQKNPTMWLSPPDSFWPLQGKTVFAIVASMRTGTNLLERVLDYHDDVFCHGELFNPDFVGFQNESTRAFGGFERAETERRDSDLAQFFQAMIGSVEQPIVGYRIFQNHNKDALRQTIFNPDIKKVILRRSLLETFVSHKVAQATDQWLVEQRTARKPFEKIQFSTEEFLRYSARNSLYYNEIYHALASTGQSFAAIDYDELKSPAAINRLARFLGSEDELEAVPELLLKQNLRGVQGSVENYDQMIDNLQKLQIRRFI
jgi:hypothetical protein